MELSSQHLHSASNTINSREIPQDIILRWKFLKTHPVFSLGFGYGSKDIPILSQAAESSVSSQEGCSCSCSHFVTVDKSIGKRQARRYSLSLLEARRKLFPQGRLSVIPRGTENIGSQIRALKIISRYQIACAPHRCRRCNALL